MDVLLLLGGLAFFLYGMNVLSGGLRKVAGGSLERSLKKITDNRWMAMLLGFVITIAIQSSSAMTVMLVGLVNSGIMQFGQTIGVIMGSNIGTTVTTWITSLSGVSGEGVISMLKPENFAPVLAFFGIVLIVLCKKPRKQDLGKILVGFAILMYGMVMMGDSVENLQSSSSFTHLLTAFDNPFVAVVASTIFTGVIQSSAATISIVQNLALSGQITYNMAIPLVLGANIGTCVTALISSVGVNKNAKKVAVVHTIIKIIGTVVCMGLFYGADLLFDFQFVDSHITTFGVAMVHTVFNVVNTVILFPFWKHLERLTNLLVRPSKTAETTAFLDERLLSTVSIAVSEANARTSKMAQIARTTILSSISLLHSYDEKTANAVLAHEDELDMYEDKLGTFLVKLARKSLSEKDSQEVSKMLHTIGDLERLGDHAVNLLHSAQEIHDKKITFSAQARRELENLTSALNDILNLTIRSFCEEDLDMARRVEPLEQVIDLLIAETKSAHVERLRAGTCTIEMGFVLSDLLTNYERVSDHCSNIAVALIETHAGSFGTHEYLNEIKETGSHEFAEIFRDYKEKYRISDS